MYIYSGKVQCLTNAVSATFIPALFVCQSLRWHTKITYINAPAAGVMLLDKDIYEIKHRSFINTLSNLRLYKYIN